MNPSCRSDKSFREMMNLIKNSCSNSKLHIIQCTSNFVADPVIVLNADSYFFLEDLKALKPLSGT